MRNTTICIIVFMSTLAVLHLNSADSSPTPLPLGAQLFIEDDECEPSEADAVVTFNIRIAKTSSQSVENVSAKVGDTDAEVSETSTSPTEVVYSGTATVDCDATYDITATAEMVIEISGPATPVTCNACEECEE